MLELVLVRHGETKGNVNKTYMGWTDLELTPEGIRQAEKVRERMSEESFSAVYSSPQKRTLQTAKIICGKKIDSDIKHDPDIITDDDLRERNFGIFDNLTYEEISQRYPEAHDAWIKDWINYRIPDGESAADVYKRVSGYLAKLIDTYEKYECVSKCKCNKVLLVTHKGWIMNAAAFLLGMPVEGLWHFHVDPGSITRFEIRDGFCVMRMLNG